MQSIYDRNFRSTDKSKQFCSVFRPKFATCHDHDKRQANFRATGIYPFNSKAVRLPGEAEQAQTSPTRKAFLPIHTPMPLLTPLLHRRQLDSPIAYYCHFESPIASRYEFESPITCSPSDPGRIECQPFNLPEPVSAQTLQKKKLLALRSGNWKVMIYPMKDTKSG